MDYGCHKQMREDDERQPIWAKQRAERGFDDTELWALDMTFVEFMLPRLKAFSKHLISHPHGITHEDWKSKLQTIIEALEEYKKRDSFPVDWDTKKIDEGLKLLVEYFYDLWD